MKRLIDSLFIPPQFKYVTFSEICLSTIKINKGV